MESYYRLCPTSYVRESNVRRFLVQVCICECSQFSDCSQRDMYDEVKSTEGTVVHIETNHGSGGPPTGSSAWISVAAGNVLPDVLLRLTAGKSIFVFTISVPMRPLRCSKSQKVAHLEGPLGSS